MIAFYLQVSVSTETPFKWQGSESFFCEFTADNLRVFSWTRFTKQEAHGGRTGCLLGNKKSETALAALSANGSGTRCFYFPVCKERKDPFSSGQILKGKISLQRDLLKKLLGQSHWNWNEIIWKNLKVESMRPLTVLYYRLSFQGYHKLTFHTKHWIQNFDQRIFHSFLTFDQIFLHRKNIH